MRDVTWRQYALGNCLRHQRQFKDKLVIRRHNSLRVSATISLELANLPGMFKAINPKPQTLNPKVIRG